MQSSVLTTGFGMSCKHVHWIGKKCGMTGLLRDENGFKDILEGHHKRCHDQFRMYTNTFLKLCEEVMQQGIVRERDVSIEEQVGMFLQTVAHSDPMRKVGEDFQCSTETVWRSFNGVLHSILRFGPKYMKLPDNNTPIHPKVSDGTVYAAFKNALGAIDGTHIPAFSDPNEENPERYRNRKQVMSQNVMAVVDFNGNFLAVTSGWEGSTHDNLILRKALDDGFVVPPNMYYLVDGGYANTGQFVSDIEEFDVPVPNDISFGDNYVMAGFGSIDNSVGNELRESIMNELWNES